MVVMVVVVYAGGDGGGDVAPVFLVPTVSSAQDSEGRVCLSDVEPFSLSKLSSNQSKQSSLVFLSPLSHHPVIVTFFSSALWTE